MSLSLADRFYVMKRDRFTCIYCGAHPPNVELEVDHFFPASRGGSDHTDNLVTACRDCNRGKGTMLWDDDMAYPGNGSPLWKWVNLGAQHATDVIRDHILLRDDKTLAEVVEELWPEADY